MKKCKQVFLICLLIAVFVSVPLQGAGTGDEKLLFPPASPESQGISSVALENLQKVIQGYFDSGEIVGAEFLVVKKRKLVFHRVVGWRDREEKKAMEINTLFNIRSMTKPVTSAAIHILAGQGKLAIGDPVFKYIKGFDNDKSKMITIEQLLTHRSGLPLSLLEKRGDLEAFENLQAMADETGRRGPEFEPGGKFWYSDAGTEVLGAIVEKVSGMSLNEFRKRYILDPLGMSDTFTMSPETEIGKEQSDRIASLYGGGMNQWNRFWKPGDKPYYPFALGSQSLYSTPRDYARFLCLWLEGGVFNSRRILSTEAVNRILTPGSRMTSLGSDVLAPTGFPGHELHYGRLSQLWLDRRNGGTGTVKVIGHTGSDGTFAWAWPDLDLIVCYFTQSRGQATGIKLETDLQRLLIEPGMVDAGIPLEWKPLMGVYTGTVGALTNREVTVKIQNGRLAVDVPGQIVFELEDPDEGGLRRFAITPLVSVSFARDDSGNVQDLIFHQTTPLGRKPDSETEAPADIPETYRPYVGTYLLAGQNLGVKVLVKENRLFVEVPGNESGFLSDPDEKGVWHADDSETISVTFDRDGEGNAQTMNLLQLIPIPRGKCVPCRVENEARGKGASAAVSLYRELKKNHSSEYVFNERGFNLAGYNLLNSGKIDEAIAVFTLNTEAYPESANVYDSLGEAWMKKGDKEKAIVYYRKSLELNPKNENAVKMLKELEKKE